ncbi:MAG: cytochrome c maturation protein CcmE [Planctomycetota bacterium]|jgi:cytochrome c-type biogenesis protein CcmE
MKRKMVIKILLGVLIIGGGIGYFMYHAMQSSWSYYYTVDDFTADDNPAVKNQSIKIAGRVKQGSIVRDLQKVSLNFTLTGSKTELPVQYKGTVPDNFSEDREVVVEGRLDTTGMFQADMLMTKCESKYKAKVD